MSHARLSQSRLFQTRRARIGVAAAAAAALLTLTACSSGSGDDAPSDDASDAPSGEITVLTNRTDLVDTTFQEYKKTFEDKYPDVTVKFEALTDYEGEVKTRMSTKDYGDVLLIPNGVATSDLPDFFEPLGTVSDLKEKYRFVGSHVVDDTVYGVATFGNANGYVYNRKVVDAAGVTEAPKSPQEFEAMLKAIKDKTDAVPLYTNYADGWPLTWPQGDMGAVSGDADALVKMSENDSPWASGEEKADLDSLLYDVVEQGLVEDDPTTTNWENSKNLLGTGKIGVMMLGTWALPQMQQAATDAGESADDIGYWPTPFQAGGKFNSPVGGDWNIGININSEHKAAARAWLDWFVDDSGFYEVAGGLPTRKDLDAPAGLADFESTGVQYVEMTPAPKLSDIDNASEIGIGLQDYYRKLVDAARGASGEKKQDIFDANNTAWASARATVG